MVMLRTDKDQDKSSTVKIDIQREICDGENEIPHVDLWNRARTKKELVYLKCLGILLEENK